MNFKTLLAAVAIGLFGLAAASPASACDLGYTDYCYGWSYHNDDDSWRWE